MVSKEVTDDDLLQAWHEVLKKWHQNLAQKPKQVSQLAKKGIPEALRGEVWQLLAGCQDNSELLEAYRVLITKVVGFDYFCLGFFNICRCIVVQKCLSFIHLFI